MGTFPPNTCLSGALKEDLPHRAYQSYASHSYSPLAPG